MFSSSDAGAGPEGALKLRPADTGRGQTRVCAIVCPFRVLFGEARQPGPESGAPGPVTLSAGIQMASPPDFRERPSKAFAFLAGAKGADKADPGVHQLVIDRAGPRRRK